MTRRTLALLFVGTPVLLVAFWAYQIALSVASGWCLLKRRVGGWI